MAKPVTLVTFVLPSTLGHWGSGATEVRVFAVADSADDFEARLLAVFGALQRSEVLAGFCYTQLTDTLQEANGLTDGARVPKLPAEVIRRIVAGVTAD